MQAIELPEEFQITTKKASGETFGHVYMYKNLKEGKAMKFKIHAKSAFGIPLLNTYDPLTNFNVTLYREGPNLLNIVLFSFTNLKVIKRMKLHIQKNSTNLRFALRVCSKTRRIILYHESLATIQIRSLLSLNVISSYSLSDICQELQLTNAVPELATSLDCEYVSHLSSIVLLLGSKIVLVPDQKSNKSLLVIFDGKEIDRFIKIVYNPEKKILLAVGVSSILLMQFDDFGASGLRLLTSGKIGKVSRFTYWDPKEEIVVFSQRAGNKAENYHILSYRPSNLTLVASLLSVPVYGNLFDVRTQTLFFIEDGLRHKRLCSVSLKDLDKYAEKSDEPAVLEGECLTYMDKIEPQTDSYYLNYCRGTLVVKPCPVISDHFTQEDIFKGC